MITFGHTKQNILIFWALLRRDLKKIKSDLRGQLIDSAFLVSTQLLVFGKLFPLLGMPLTMVGPIFFSQLVFQGFFFGYGLALELLFDLEGKRFIDYQLTLPISKWWVMAEYVTAFVIKTIIVTLPTFVCGSFFLGPALIDFSPQWILFACFYLLSFTFFGIFFMMLAFHYEFMWFNTNAWPRRLTPLMMLSPNFFIWSLVYEFSPIFGKIMLINPTTYLIDGVRGALFTSYRFLPISTCLVGSICFILLCIWGLKKTTIKRLDPV